MMKNKKTENFFEFSVFYLSLGPGSQSPKIMSSISVSI